MYQIDENNIILKVNVVESIIIADTKILWNNKNSMELQKFYVYDNGIFFKVRISKAVMLNKK